MGSFMCTGGLSEMAGLLLVRNREPARTEALAGAMVESHQLVNRCCRFVGCFGSWRAFGSMLKACYATSCCHSFSRKVFTFVEDSALGARFKVASGVCPSLSSFCAVR